MELLPAPRTVLALPAPESIDENTIECTTGVCPKCGEHTIMLDGKCISCGYFMEKALNQFELANGGDYEK